MIFYIGLIMSYPCLKLIINIHEIIRNNYIYFRGIDMSSNS